MKSKSSTILLVLIIKVFFLFNRNSLAETSFIDNSKFLYLPQIVFQEDYLPHLAEKLDYNYDYQTQKLQNKKLIRKVWDVNREIETVEVFESWQIEREEKYKDSNFDFKKWFRKSEEERQKRDRVKMIKIQRCISDIFKSFKPKDITSAKKIWKEKTKKCTTQ